MEVETGEKAEEKEVKVEKKPTTKKGYSPPIDPTSGDLMVEATVYAGRVAQVSRLVLVVRY